MVFYYRVMELALGIDVFLPFPHRRKGTRAATEARERNFQSLQTKAVRQQAYDFLANSDL